MSTLNICMFGKLRMRRNGLTLDEFACGKAQELFCYLLLHRGSPLPRESLASLLWGNRSTAQSGQYLRQSLWKLQTKLNSPPAPNQILLIEHDWIRFNPQADLWAEETDQVVWRGQIIHVVSGERRYLKELDGIVEFIFQYLKALGMKFKV